MERKLSTSNGGNMKSKWVNAFKNIKGKQEVGKAASVAAGPPPILENSHVFQEYTYKKITPCDVCSQILRGAAPPTSTSPPTLPHPPPPSSTLGGPCPPPFRPCYS